MGQWKEQRRRYTALDAVRGTCLISMILYHGMYDLVYLYGVDAPWYRGLPGYLWQQSICWTFILLSGICWTFGRQHVRRGLAVTLCGALITAVTAVVTPGQVVLFGILTFLGAAMLLMIPVEKAACLVAPGPGAAGSFLLFAVLRNVNRGELGFEGFVLCRLPEVTRDSFLLEFLGFPSPGFFSSDYFSLLPWFFLYLAGYFVWRLAEDRQGIRGLLTIRVPLLQGLGKNTLPIYMLHQPVLMAVLEVLGRTGIL